MLRSDETAGRSYFSTLFSLLHLRAGQTRVVRLGGRSSALRLRRKSLPVVYSDPFPLNKTEVAKRLSLFKYY